MPFPVGERDLRWLLDSLTDAIVIGRGERLLYANPRAARLFGAQSVTELLARSAYDLVHAEDVPDLQRELAELDGPGRASPDGANRRALKLGGAEIIVDVRARRIEYDGAPAHAVVLRDVTTQAIERERLQMTNRLTTVGTLSAAIGHEINNPLTVVCGNLELLTDALEQLRADPSDARVDELQVLAREAAVGAERIRRILRAVRTLVRQTNRPQPEPLALEESIGAALQLTNNALIQRARIVRDLRPTPRVDADETRLTQVLVNLLTNAAQAIEEGHREQHTIRVATWTSAEGRAVIEVGDDGMGIAPGNLSRIFDPFFTTQDVGQGTGLGLAIAHSIVDSLGGEIRVNSAQGAGSTFRIELPASARAASVEPVPIAVVALPRRSTRLRVLIVDDEPAVATVLSRILAPHYEVTVAHDGLEALRILTRGEIDVVLSDLMMPGMSGDVLLEQIAVRFPQLVTRVIFMSGGAFTPSTAAFLDRVANPRVEKPIDMAQLMLLIHATAAGELPSERVDQAQLAR